MNEWLDGPEVTGIPGWISAAKEGGYAGAGCVHREVEPVERDVLEGCSDTGRELYG